MALDRFIEWGRGKRRPSAKTITNTVKSFFGPRGPLVETDSDRLYIATSEEHWIEVVLTEGTVDVITRRADRATRMKANDLARFIATTHDGQWHDDPKENLVSDPDSMEDDGGFV